MDTRTPRGARRRSSYTTATDTYPRAKFQEEMSSASSFGKGFDDGLHGFPADSSESMYEAGYEKGARELGRRQQAAQGRQDAEAGLPPQQKSRTYAIAYVAAKKKLAKAQPTAGSNVDEVG